MKGGGPTANFDEIYLPSVMPALVAERPRRSCCGSASKAWMARDEPDPMTRKEWFPYDREPLQQPGPAPMIQRPPEGRGEGSY